MQQNSLRVLSKGCIIGCTIYDDNQLLKAEIEEMRGVDGLKLHLLIKFDVLQFCKLALENKNVFWFLLERVIHKTLPLKECCARECYKVNDERVNKG